jgi:catechol 2,3-dioxygenase-like lactoylglutathione lyase family enzyme
VELGGLSTVAPQGTGRLHHVELWVEDLEQSGRTLGWMFEQLGYVPGDDWPTGRSWRGAGEYLVLEAGPDVEPGTHARKRPGLNHLAFHAGAREDVERLARAAQQRGWRLMFADRHPFAGGPEHFAAYLEDAAGFEIELVAGE